MLSSREVIRGTFRISIVVAVLAAAYTAYQDLQANKIAERELFNMWAAYECAAQLSEEELKPSLNEDGLFDLRKVGCTTERFLASSEELSQAGALRRKWLLDNARTFDVGNAILSACVWFVVVNLLGLGFIAVRGTVRWIVAGFRARA